MPDEFVSLESLLSDAELRQLIQISTGLVKTVKACLKKACAILTAPETVPATEICNEAIDEIIECCNKVSQSSGIVLQCAATMQLVHFIPAGTLYVTQQLSPAYWYCICSTISLPFYNLFF